jgi:phage FluMu protein Com
MTCTSVSTRPGSTGYWIVMKKRGPKHRRCTKCHKWFLCSSFRGFQVKRCPACRRHAIVQYFARYEPGAIALRSRSHRIALPISLQVALGIQSRSFEEMEKRAAFPAAPVNLTERAIISQRN